MRDPILYPMAFYVLYIWILLLLNLRIRKQAIKSREISIKYFQSFSEGAPSKKITTWGRHIDNQFQVPLLFLITGAVHMVTTPTNFLTLILAWAFVASRLVHSFIHLGSNNIMLRAGSYALGWLMILLLWLQILFAETTGFIFQ